MKTHVQTDPMLKSLLALAVAALLLTTLSAQGPSPQEKIAALKESLAANQAALKQYSWIETTAISISISGNFTDQGLVARRTERRPNRRAGGSPARRAAQSDLQSARSGACLGGQGGVVRN